MRGWYRGLVGLICRDSFRHPWRWVLAILLVTVPAALEARRVGIDTNLIRLLPLDSPAASLTRELDPVVSDGGYFTLLAESSDRELLRRTIEGAAARVAALPGVESVQHRWPVDFYRQWRYLLVPNDYLVRVSGEILEWEAEVSPFVEDLGGPPAGEGKTESFGEREDREDLERSLKHLSDLEEYHQSDDGKVMGMIIRTRRGVTSLGDVERLYGELRSIADEMRRTPGVWAGVGGSHRNKLDEIALIKKDLGRAGTFSGLLIAAVLLFTFRSLPALVPVMLPMWVGLLWAFALVPLTVGDFNLITAFILVIMFGLGVENSIYLVKRYQMEIPARGPEEGLLETYLSTGPSVIISGLTTGFSLLLLGVASFRGFSEFGFIGFISIIMIMLSMFVVLPPVMVLCHRFGLLPRYRTAIARPPRPRRRVTVTLLLLLVAALAAAVGGLRFDYNFRNLQFDREKVEGSKEVRSRQNLVYSGSISPGALYVADDVAAVDRLEALLREAGERPGSTVGRVRSLRDFAPSAGAMAERRVLLADIREEVAGSWTERIEDPDRKRLVDDFRAWREPPDSPTAAEVPEALSRPLMAKDGSGRFIVTVHPAVDRKNGRNAMAFADELAGVGPVRGVKGPVGETVVFAEIIRTVIAEGPLLVVLTIALVFAIVFAYQRSLPQTLLILFPLIGGVVLALGGLVAANLKLNFFNIVVIPSLLGMGVDSGVHYFRRWRELAREVGAVQAELFEPMTVANWTTAIGYAGMLLADHPGIRSIGLFAVIGCLFAWVANLFLFPGVLSWMPGAGSPPERGEGGAR